MRKAFSVKGCFYAILLAGVVALASPADDDAPVVNSIRMNRDNGVTKFVIEKAGAMECQDFFLKNPNRLVIDFIGAKHGFSAREFEGDGRLVEKVRTSQFMNAPDEITRVVFDLKDESTHKIKEEGDKVVVEFYNENGLKPAVMTGSAFAPVNPTAASWAPIQNRNKVESPDVSTETVREIETPSANKSVLTGEDMQPAAGANSLEGRESTPSTAALASAWKSARFSHNTAPDFMQESGMGRMAANNKKITLDVQNADIKTVLESFAEFSGVNIISGPEVSGDVTAHIKNLPWRKALDILLKTHGFGSEEQYGVIRVSTTEKLTKEELEKEAANRKKDDLLPLTTRIVPLAFANAEEIQKALKRIASQRGNIEVEPGSNALIVTDILKNVDKIEEMARSLDQKLKQVEIIAKLVDVDINATRDLGIRWDFLNLSPANVGVVGDAVIDVQSPAPAGTFRLGTVRSWGELRTVLDMLEQTNKANIMSNPRIITADNREANILVGKEIPLIVADEAGNPITELTKVGIGLKVTPHINLDGTITLDINPQVSELSSQATVQGGVIISLSEADTRVIVDDGETAVIGGLMSEVTSSLERGLPMIKDIPFIGNLFKYKNTTKKKRELIIFITPRVVENLAEHSS